MGPWLLPLRPMLEAVEDVLNDGVEGDADPDLLLLLLLLPACSRASSGSGGRSLSVSSDSIGAGSSSSSDTRVACEARERSEWLSMAAETTRTGAAGLLRVDSRLLQESGGWAEKSKGGGCLSVLTW